MSPKVWQVYGIGLLMLTLLFVVAIPHYTKRIPEVLEYVAREHLREQGIEWTHVRADGRDLLLSGDAPDSLAQQHARQAVEDIRGVRHVIDRMTLKTVSPYTMSIDWHEGHLTVDGFVPDEASYQTIGALMTDTYGDNHTSGELRIANGSPERWTALLGVLVNGLVRLEQARAEIVDRQLHVSGKSASSDMRDQLGRALTAFEQHGYVLDLRISGDETAARICQQAFNDLLKTPIYFESGEAQISERSRSLIERLAETAKLCPEAHITIAGHTDDQGDGQNNLKLSEQRARAVASELSQEGIEPGRIKAVGYGANRPIADNASEAGRAKNRRIEFVVQLK